MTSPSAGAGHHIPYIGLSLGWFLNKDISLTFLRSTLPRILFKLFLLICFFHLPHIYFQLYAVPLSLPEPAVSNAEVSSSRTLEWNLDTPIQWPRLSERLKAEWKLAKSASLALLSLNFALLQIDAVSSSTVTKTTTVLSFWLAVASLVCCILQSCLSPMKETYESLLDGTKYQAFMFWIVWISMILPTSFAIWSSINLMITVGIYSYAGTLKNDGSDAAVPVEKCVVSTVLVLIGLTMLVVYLPILRVAVTLGRESHPSPGGAEAHSHEDEANTTS
ncbi:hypothetical protein BDN72DRAFT_845594 [Pluteus cervinus]|uniref:Uncharacterized protein n=1 Tax=Pluteus cervinus TaxID=181527 RepID=A0ACD3AID4_9AGAR|nr:hypothetical protein BDN72DRAFT_845594 [Pluteus cervinus]